MSLTQIRPRQINLTELSGSGLIVGGALPYVNLSIGAGDGIDVAADSIAVDVTDIIDTNYGLTEDSNNIWVSLDSAGALEFNSGAIRIKLATNHGLDRSASGLALGVPNYVSASSLNGVITSTHTHGVEASSDVSSGTGYESLLKSTSSGGLTLNSLVVNGNLDILQGGDLTVGANILFVNASASNIGINCAPDGQFDLDVEGNLRAKGWIVGKHALQVDDAIAIMQFDGAYPFETDYSGVLQTHLGISPTTVTGGTIFRPGLFQKSLQIGEGTSNILKNPSFEYDTIASGSVTGWISSFSSSALEIGGVYGEQCLRVSETAYIGSKQIFGEFYPCSGSTDYTFSIHTKINGTANIIEILRIYFYDSSSAVLATYGDTVSVVDNHDWNRFSVSGSSPINAEYFRVNYAMTTTPFSAFDIWFDAAQMEENYLTPYIDGSLGGMIDGSNYLVGSSNTHNWSDVANNSTSTRTGAKIDYSFDYLAGSALPDTYTFMAWIYPNEVGTHNNFIYQYGSGNYNRQLFYINSSDAKLRAIVYVNGSTSSELTVTTSTSLTPLQWHHVAFVLEDWQSGSMSGSAYLGGSLVGHGASTSPPDSRSTVYLFGLGRNNTSDANYLNGLMDSVAIISGDVGADFIRAAYESEAPLFAETSTFSFRTPSLAPIWADDEGFYMRDSAGSTIFGWSSVDGKSWAGSTLNMGDALIGTYGASEGGWFNWKRSYGTLQLGYGTTSNIIFTPSGATIAGWDMEIGKISSCGIDLNSGSGASIAFGDTPPSGSSTGTGVYIDRVGFFGLNDGTRQIVVSATDGKLYAGNNRIEVGIDGLITRSYGYAIDMHTSSSARGGIQLFYDSSALTNVVSLTRSDVFDELISNRSFETGTTGWTLASETSASMVRVSTSNAYHGNAALYSIITNPDILDPNEYTSITSDYIVASPYDQYRFSFYINKISDTYTAGNTPLTSYIYFYNSSNTLLDTYIFNDYVPQSLNNIWTYINNISGSAPTATAKLKVKLELAAIASAVGGTEVFYIDYFSCAQGGSEIRIDLYDDQIQANAPFYFDDLVEVGTSLRVGTDAASISSGHAVITNKLYIHPSNARTTSSYGIQFYNDVLLYRSAANTLYTPDKFQSGSGITGTVGIFSTAGVAGGIHLSTDVHMYRSATNNLYVDSKIQSGSGITATVGVFSTAGTSGGLHIGGDGRLYRSATNTLYTPNIFLVGNDIRTGEGLSVGSISNDAGTGDIWATGDIYQVARTSYSPGYAGWTATPTRTCYYKKIGNTVIYWFYVTGTSNSVNSYIQLPVVTTTRIDGTFIYDGAMGYGVSGAYATNSGSVLNLYGAWAGSGVKTAQGFVVYESA